MCCCVWEFVNLEESFFILQIKFILFGKGSKDHKSIHTIEMVDSRAFFPELPSIFTFKISSGWRMTNRTFKFQHTKCMYSQQSADCRAILLFSFRGRLYFYYLSVYFNNFEKNNYIPLSKKNRCTLLPWQYENLERQITAPAFDFTTKLNYFLIFFVHYYWVGGWI